MPPDCRCAQALVTIEFHAVDNLWISDVTWVIRDVSVGIATELTRISVRPLGAVSLGPAGGGLLRLLSGLRGRRLARP
jgi:hypothetical protein